jgi:hypothetical protein
VSVLPANLQDRDATRDLLSRARRRFPFIERIFADAGYQGPKMAKTIAATGRWKIEIKSCAPIRAATMSAQPQFSRLRGQGQQIEGRHERGYEVSS